MPNRAFDIQGKLVAFLLLLGSPIDISESVSSLLASGSIHVWLIDCYDVLNAWLSMCIYHIWSLPVSNLLPLADMSESVCMCSQAAHGFVTSGHRWVDNIGVFINLEATGSGGPDTLFQHTGSWTAQTYAKAAPYPRGSVFLQVTSLTYTKLDVPQYYQPVKFYPAWQEPERNNFCTCL